MKTLFVHQNFPGQFPHIARALAARPGHEVVALTMRAIDFPGVRVVTYQPQRTSSPAIHPWVVDFETKVVRGEAAFLAARQLKEEGFHPDLVVVHPGWGEGLFLNTLWPRARILMYAEFYYHAKGYDVGFDPEFDSPGDAEMASRVELKNANMLLHMAHADAALSPTIWQKSTYPETFQSRIRVMHDGIDTGLARPRPDVMLKVRDRVLTRQNEVVTFVSRQLEPYRGFHSFMRALPEILRRRPDAEVMIVGGDQRGYGGLPPGGGTWKAKFLAEVRDQIDPARVHFLGKIPYDQFLGLLQLSSVHVYLTYPFVLSWSLIEAMSSGAAIVGSRTAPVEEVIRDRETGLLVDFFSPKDIAERVVALLEDRGLAARLGAAARDEAIARFDLKTVCLPGQLRILSEVAAGTS